MAEAVEQAHLDALDKAIALQKHAIIQFKMLTTDNKENSQIADRAYEQLGTLVELRAIIAPATPQEGE